MPITLLDQTDKQELEAKIDAIEESIGNIDTSGSEITVDTQLSETSTNPVQNKVVHKALTNIINEVEKGVTYRLGSFEEKLYKDINAVSANFVTKEEGKGLSSNDFTDEYKNMLDNAETELALKVTNVSESTEDDGSNIVTFSDGSIVTIKNGSKGSKGEKGADGYTPVKGTDYFTEADKEEMIEDVVASIDGIPDYWLSALDSGVNSIRQAMESAGRNKSAFLFYSDAHWDNGSQLSPKLLKYLYQNTAMTKTFFGGDIVNSESTDRDTMEYLYEWREMLKGLPNHHSVVGNHDDGNATNNLFSENYVYAYLLSAEETPNMVLGEGMYYYIDEPCEKTRYLFLDTAYKGVDTTQENFIKEALKSTSSGWHIVVVSHIWYMPDYDQYSVRPTPIKGLDTNATKVITLLDNYNSRTGDFADCGGKVEFCIGGHVHYDYTGTTTGGIPIILVETDSHYTRGEFAVDSNDKTTEASVNGIIADYENHKITVVRVGRGSGCTVNLETGETHTHSYTSEITSAATCTTAGVRTYTCSCGYTYTETIPVISHNYVDGVCTVCGAEDGNNTPTYTNILDTAGYTKGIYLSNFNEGSDENAYTTGFIPVSNSTDIVYLENITMPYGGGHGCRVAHYDINKEQIEGACYGIDDNVPDKVVEKDEITNDIKAFRVNHSACRYIRISAQYIDENSIITVNQEIE